jgi:hypothetical protein
MGFWACLECGYTTQGGATRLAEHVCPNARLLPRTKHRVTKVDVQRGTLETEPIDPVMLPRAVDP